MPRRSRWSRYVPVAERRAEARRRVAELASVGIELRPIEVEGRVIARTPWGHAWCEHLERLTPDSGRLGRGRSYARNGAICDLHDEGGRIEAVVSGSAMYHVIIEFAPAEPEAIEGLLEACRRGLGSTLELLRGRVSNAMMELATRPESGLLPGPGVMRVGCTCPDWSVQCKHVTAVLYGVGHRLDEDPELLFRLRGVDPAEVMDAAAAAALAGVGGVEGAEGAEGAEGGAGAGARAGGEAGAADDAVIDDARLAEIFGIELEVAAAGDPAKQDDGGGGGSDGGPGREPEAGRGIRPPGGTGVDPDGAGSPRAAASDGATRRSSTRGAKATRTTSRRGRTATAGGRSSRGGDIAGDGGTGAAVAPGAERATRRTKGKDESAARTGAATRRKSTEPRTARRSSAASRGRSPAGSASRSGRDAVDPRAAHLERLRRLKPTGASIRRMRRSMALTVAEFAELLQVSPATVTRWEQTRGRLNLQRRTLAALDELDRETSPQR